MGSYPTDRVSSRNPRARMTSGTDGGWMDHERRHAAFGQRRGRRKNIAAGRGRHFYSVRFSNDGFGPVARADRYGAVQGLDLATPIKVMTKTFLDDLGLNNSTQALRYSTSTERREDVDTGEGFSLGLFRKEKSVGVL